MTLEIKIEDVLNDKIHRFDGYVIFIREDGITQLQFEKGFSGDKTDAVVMVETFKVLNQPKKCLLLVIYEEDNTFSKDARDYIASEEVSNIIKADALVIKGLALRIIGNGYLKINKPNRPTKLFTSADTAIDWLSQFK